MKSSELFGVAVKAVGLYFIVQGIYRLLQIFDVIVSSMTTGAPLGDALGRGSIGGYIFAAALHFAIGALFLKRGDWLIGFAYPSPQNPEALRVNEKPDA